DGISSQLPTGYVLDQVKGTVLIIPKGASQPMTAQTEQTVQVGDEIITQADSEASLTFNGAAMIQLSEGSDLKVGDLAAPSGKGFLSRLKLLAGQVLAQVQKMGTSHSVFEIESGGVVCGVRGTAFEVQKEGASIVTNTYEGTVEMDRKDLSQKVPAGRHSEFDTDKGLFHLQRLLNAREEERYRNWQRYRDLIAQRQKEREAALKAFDALPQTDKAQLWQGLQKAGDRDRFRILRAMMREKNQHDRLQVIDKSLQARTDSLNGMKDTEKRAQEQRELELRKLKKKKKVE
ncbi:MAG TPA: FecR family protein, partial [bacterium]|nr:FecR family protein [bacterium]